MSLDWTIAEWTNAKAVQDAEEPLKEMVRRLVDSLGEKITDEARTRLALHMATVYGGDKPLRTFCALPYMDVDDEKLAETADGAEYVRLRGPKDDPVEKDPEVSDAESAVVASEP